MNFNLIEYFFPKETIQIDFDFGNDTFINRFKEYIEDDRGYFYDELFSSKKQYLGKIDSTAFVLRQKRKFMNLNISTCKAKGEISETKDKTSIKIELNGNDTFHALAKIVLHLFIVILFVFILVKGIYPLLILFIPLSIAFLAFLNFIQKKQMQDFRKSLLKNLNELRIKKTF